MPGGGLALFALCLVTLAAYLGFTYRVATASALKGTYLSSAAVPFALCVGVGCERMARHSRRLALGVAGLFASFVAVSSAVFWIGWLSPLEISPAARYLQAHRDAATLRVYEYFVGPAPAPASEAPRQRHPMERSNPRPNRVWRERARDLPRR